MGTFDESSFGDLLQSFRRRKKLTQAGLAREVEASRSTISLWERGAYLPDTVSRVHELVKILQLNEQEARMLFDAVYGTASLVDAAVTISCYYSIKDEELHKRLVKNLAVLQQEGMFTKWYDCLIPETNEIVDVHHFIENSIILLLVSSYFLHDFVSAASGLTYAMDKHQDYGAIIIPIILRPVVEKDLPFPFSKILPQNAKPVTTWKNRDEAFQNIVTGIRLACEQVKTGKFVWSVPATGTGESSHNAKSLHSYPLYEVFVKSGVPNVTFVEREDFELLKLSLAQPGRGVVVEGPSGVGKTTAIEKAVEDLSIDQHRLDSEISLQILSARNPEHIHRLQTLHEWHTGTVIVDDFHRLDPDLRAKLVDYLKYLADIEPFLKKLVIVGIPQTGQTLVDVSFDIATRIDVFKLDVVSDELVLRMIEKGEAALNINFDRKEDIVLAANGSLNIAQFLCFNICHKAKITKTQNQQQIIPCDIDTAISNVMTDLSRKFGESIRRFAAIGGRKDSIGLLLLEKLAHSENGFLSLNNLKGSAPPLTRSIERYINEHWMDTLYRAYPTCAQHLFFDQTTHALVIDDPQLAFYLKKLDFSTLAREVGGGPILTQQKIFISYSHKDRRWLERLRVHLKPIEREGTIELWDDTKIETGAQWKDTIWQALETAQVAVLLISANFLASNFIAEHELPRLLAHAESEGMIILPIIVSPCLVKETALGTFQSVNPPNRPLSAMAASEREQVLVNVAETIKKRLFSEEKLSSH